MSLKDKLALSQQPAKPLAVVAWLRELPEDEFDAAWQILINPDNKTYTVLNWFKEEGGRFGKDSFVPFRKNVLNGTVTKESIRVSK